MISFITIVNDENYLQIRSNVLKVSPWHIYIDTYCLNSI